MNNLKQKTKEWYDNNKESIKKEVVKLTCYGVGYAFGVLVATKITECNIALGIERLHHKGLIRFFDTSTGLEIEIDELAKITSEMTRGK